MLRKYAAEISLALIGALLFLPFLGKVHLFDWDEINFAEAAREMIVLGDYLRVHINFLPFWEKPPLFFWMQAASMHLFGVNEYAARFPNALLGVVYLVLLFRLGKRLHSARFGWLWAAAYGGSFLPHFYFKSGIIDPWLNLFIFLGLYQFILFQWKKNPPEGAPTTQLSAYTHLALSGLFTGLGVLTKGPVALLLVSLTVAVWFFWQWIKRMGGLKNITPSRAISQFQWTVTPLSAILLVFFTLLVTGTWFGAETLKNGPWFVTEFTLYQIHLFTKDGAGHGGFPGYHFVILLVGCFPASLFALRGMKLKEFENEANRDFWRWMMSLFWVVLLLFTIVQTKIVHYSSMCYLPLSYLAATTLDRVVQGEIRPSWRLRAGLWGLAVLFSLLLIAIPLVGMNIEAVQALVEKDRFTHANLNAEVLWEGDDLLIGAIFFFTMAAGLLTLARKRRTKLATMLLFGGTALLIQPILYSFVPRVEQYSQAAAIEFLESLQEKDCYIHTYGYKSYAHYFYGRVKPETRPQSTDTQIWREWLLAGPVDKDVYVLTKIHKAERLKKQFPTVEKVGQKNGYVFFKREKVR